MQSRAHGANREKTLIRPSIILEREKFSSSRSECVLCQRRICPCHPNFCVSNVRLHWNFARLRIQGKNEREAFWIHLSQRSKRYLTIFDLFAQYIALPWRYNDAFHWPQLRNNFGVESGSRFFSPRQSRDKWVIPRNFIDRHYRSSLDRSRWSLGATICYWICDTRPCIGERPNRVRAASLRDFAAS